MEHKYTLALLLSKNVVNIRQSKENSSWGETLLWSLPSPWRIAQALNLDASYKQWAALIWRKPNFDKSDMKAFEASFSKAARAPKRRRWSVDAAMKWSTKLIHGSRRAHKACSVITRPGLKKCGASGEITATRHASEMRELFERES